MVNSFFIIFLLDIPSKEYGAESEKGCNGDNHHEEGQAIEQGLEEGGVEEKQGDLHGNIDAQEAKHEAIFEARLGLLGQSYTPVAMVADGVVVGTQQQISHASLQRYRLMTVGTFSILHNLLIVFWCANILHEVVDELDALHVGRGDERGTVVELHDGRLALFKDGPVG